MADNVSVVREKTIEDFGNQFHRHSDVSDDYVTSVEFLQDVLGPLMSTDDFKDKVVLEVGSGAGRIARMVSKVSPKKYYAVEPSKAYEVMVRNTEDLRHIVEPVNASGSEFTVSDVDLAISFGVIHHIKDPADVLANVYRCLKPGGKFVMWVYGAEGNGLYLAIFNNLRAITQRLGDTPLEILCFLLNCVLWVYAHLCRVLPLPMRGYMVDVILRCSWQKRHYIIFDQLNPAYAKYYTRQDTLDAMTKAGFTDVQLHHRHGYSWTAVGTKPA